MRKIIFMLCGLLGIMLCSSCLSDGDETLVLPEIVKAKPIEEVIPPELLQKLEENIPIHRGSTPPIIEGGYLAAKTVLVSSTLDDDKPGDLYADIYLRFSKQNKYNTIDYEARQSSSSYRSLEPISLSGSGYSFTAYFKNETINTKDGYTAVTATVISGIKTAGGIKDYYEAFLMLEKTDPNNNAVPLNTIRVFKDADGLAVNNAWTRSGSAAYDCAGTNLPSVLSTSKNTKR